MNAEMTNDTSEMNVEKTGMNEEMSDDMSEMSEEIRELSLEGALVASTKKADPVHQTVAGTGCTLMVCRHLLTRKYCKWVLKGMATS